MSKLSTRYIKSVVRSALREDLRPLGDITTNLVDIKNRKIKAKIISKQSGIISGLDFCKAAFKLQGKETKFLKKVKDGKNIKKGKVIAIITAKVKTILSAERTALNFLNHSSGISTLTNAFVKRIKNKTKICCTRKTTPNLRILEKYAVKKGGGYNHRFNLSDEILIKDNHIKASRKIEKLIILAKRSKKTITVEIENIKQLNRIIGLKFKRVLFDNMKINQLRKCVKLCKSYETEYSGNVNLSNVKKISLTGVDRISVGALTHSSASFDSSLELFS